MRRLGRYASNRTIRSCEEPGAIQLLNSYFVNLSIDNLDYWRMITVPLEDLSINKRNHWKLLNILRKYIEPLEVEKKILVRSYYNYHQYNGYSDRLRAHPPKHVAFSRRPHFIYQTRAKFIKVNQETLNIVLRRGMKYLDDSKHCQDLFDIYHSDSPITLIYFMSGSEHEYPTDWSLARKDAFGGTCASYHCHCWGLYCPFGPKIVGQVTKDSRIHEVIFVSGEERRRDLFHHCRCYKQRRKSKRTGDGDKRLHSQLKCQRQEKTRLSKQIRDDRFAFS